jgi:hypothetical protein
MSSWSLQAMGELYQSPDNPASRLAFAPRFATDLCVESDEQSRERFSLSICANFDASLLPSPAWAGEGPGVRVGLSTAAKMDGASLSVWLGSDLSEQD